MNTTTKKILNFTVFYLCWFGTAYGVIGGYPWLGPLAIGAYLLLHWLYVVPSNREILFIMIGGLIGFGADNLFFATGTVMYQSALVTFMAPVWMLFVWFSFLSMFHVSLEWLQSRLLLGGVLGGVGGPLSYHWAHSLGVFTLGDPHLHSLLILGVAWSLITPFLLWLSYRPYFRV